MGTDNTDDKKWLWLFLKIGGAVTVAWIVTLLIASVTVRKDGLAGQFGDVFGSINALFSGLAFAGVIVTVWMQREELKLQREELEATREELRGQKEQMELQNATLKLQQFESTYFQMLSLHNENLRGVVFSHSGRENFNDMWERFRGRVGEEKARKRSETQIEDVELEFSRIVRALSEATNKYQSFLPGYYRFISGMLSFAKKCPTGEAAYYADLIARQMSSKEQLMLMYFCLLPNDPYDLRTRVEEYGLLRYLPSEVYLDGFEDHKKLLSLQAFI